MAARHLRRLRLAAGDDPLAGAGDAASSGEEEGAAPAARAAPFNPFDLLAEGDAGADDDDESDDAAPPPPRAPSPPAAAPKKARRKKKGGRGDEVDAALAALGLTPVQGGEGASGGASAPAAAAARAALAVDARALNGGAESRRLFGVASTSAATPTDGDGTGWRGRGGRRTPGLGGLATGRGASAAGGLSMAPAGARPDGGQCFSYAIGAAYEAGLTALEAAQATHDPTAVASLLRARPSHADTLLVVHDLLRLTGQHEAADDVLDRALGALESGWPPAFTAAAAAGAARVDGASPANKPLFVALFRRASSLSRRGLHGAAAETAKLLLGLDEADPAGARCCLDYFLLRARRHADLLALRGVVEDAPGWAFSVPLAALRLTEGGGGARAPAPASLDPSTALQRACLTYPSFVVALADRVIKEGGAIPETLAAALARPPFARAPPPAPGLARLAAIFAERHHTVWKAPDALRALAAAAEGAAKEGGGGAWAAAAAAAWPSDAPDAFAALRVADFGDTVAALPDDEIAALRDGGGGGDAADDAAVAAPRHAAAAAAAANLARMHPLAAMLATLLPWAEDGGGAGVDWEEGA
jgi:hypothetical protein